MTAVIVVMLIALTGGSTYWLYSHGKLDELFGIDRPEIAHNGAPLPPPKVKIQPAPAAQPSTEDEDPADGQPSADGAADGSEDADQVGLKADKPADAKDAKQAKDRAATRPQPRRTRPRPARNTAKPKPTKEPPATVPEPADDPPAPEVDAEALLQQARTLQFSNPSKAYALAQQSYNAKRSNGALVVMVSAACRMNDAKKASRALGKLSEPERSTMAKACRRNGVDV
jgi:hypothetical protein